VADAVLTHVNARIPALTALVLLLCACPGRRSDDDGEPAGDGDADADGDADGDGDRPGVDTMGVPCEGACGSADERKCAIGSPDCSNDLCLVDPGHPQITYCTLDCTDLPCPEGWSCEPIASFADRAVERGCVAEPADCGDGVRQLGEACDGDTAEGRCVDCAGFEAICGDGNLQDGEVCEGDGEDGWCVGCTRLVAPHASLSVWRASAGAVDRVDGPSTYFFGVGYEGDEVAGDLPIGGDAEGCGALRVLETDATLTRFEWTLCSEWDESRLTWTFALPRDLQDLDLWDQPVPAEYAVTAVLEHPTDGRTMTWTTEEHIQIFQVRVWDAGERGHALGHLRAYFEQDDPIQTFTIDQAEIELDFELTHPVP